MANGTAAVPAPEGGKLSFAERRRQLAAACIGNVLEYYDFVVYAYLATTIGHKFFPSDNETAGLLASFAAFGVGFLARPLGGIVIGRLGDKKGRKAALLITIFGMALGTVGIGLLPTYETIGLMAPVLLVLMRLIQGLAAGGEWGGATAFIVESAPEGRRGLFGGIGQASIAASNLLSSVVVAIVAGIFTPDEMRDWAWRVPFLLGGILLPVGIYMRRNLKETPAFVEAQQAPQKAREPHDLGSPLVLLGKAFGFTVVWTVSYYIMLSYMPTFLTKEAGLTQSQALWGNSIALVVLVVATPFFGWWSDRIGRKPLLLACCAAFAVLPYPLFSVILSSPSLATIVAIQIVFNLFIAAFSGAGPSALSELFPTHSRTTLMSTGYSVAVAIFGGFAPFIATWLISSTGSSISPTYYLIFSGVVSGLVIWGFRETAHEKLR
ncbi:MFS transporter [Pseudoroseomonas ludipueritiae]|uniref:MFS transporter n=1 Tax=Pseudoroseomonas ludipueritiae TaxID=198093 RepID=A0ABR7R1K4_9PROT|nr:MFS transporter [Pseudoroseomonas ludipueritiae]MBC9175614.1 MFS transporter [Pseudoroseomonas ludipueritiae]